MIVEVKRIPIVLAGELLEKLGAIDWTAYYGVLQKLGEAMDIYSALPGFDEDELSGTVAEVAEEVASLPQKHSELWDVFKTVKGSKDKEKYERLLGDEDVRGQFYEKLNA